MEGGTDLLKLFYEESNRWSFHLESLIQLTRLKTQYESKQYIKSLIDSNETLPKLFMERSIHSSFNVFVKNSFTEKKINQVEFDILSRYYFKFANPIQANDKNNNLFNESDKNLSQINKKVINENLEFPLKFIYVKTTPKICYERLKMRNRNSEMNVSLSYLMNLHENYENWINELNEDCKLVIDGNLSKEKVLEQIDKILFT